MIALVARVAEETHYMRRQFDAVMDIVKEIC